METIVDIKATADELKQEIKTEMAGYLENGYRTPSLCVLTVGDNQSLDNFVFEKKRICEDFGIFIESYRYPIETTQEEFNAAFEWLAPQFDAMVVGYPLPSGLTLDGFEKYSTKDIACLTCDNLDKLTKGEHCYIPSAPYGIILLLEKNHYIASDKSILLMPGRRIHLQPLIDILSKNPYQASINTFNEDDDIEEIKEQIGKADIILMFDDEPYYFKYIQKRENCIIVNLKTEIAATKPLFQEYHTNHLHISPVPGGIGSMSEVAFVKNILKAYKNNYIPEENARRTAEAEELARIFAENEAINKAAAEQLQKEIDEAAQLATKEENI